MALVNRTAFAAELFRQFNLKGGLDGVLAIRGTFEMATGSRLRFSGTQEPFVWEDEYENDPLTSSYIKQTDLVPFKPGTDITFIGSSFAASACERWKCGIEIPGVLRKILTVTGPREWRRNASVRPQDGPRASNWSLTRPHPVTEVAVSGQQAYGGPRSRDDSETKLPETHPMNPIGVGWLDPNRQPAADRVPAPQLENPDDPILDWRRSDYIPESFAPVPPWSSFRLPFAGTFDEEWLKSRHPLMPENFDYRFWQSAPPGLIVKPWLEGDEEIRSLNLHREDGNRKIRLPRILLCGILVRDNESELRFPCPLDGVHINFTVEKRLSMTWRGVFPWAERKGKIYLEQILGDESK